MKHTFFAILAIASLLIAGKVSAQDTKTDTVKKKNHNSIILGRGGIKIKASDSTHKTKDDDDASGDVAGKPRFKSHFFSMDLGINLLQDNTNYKDAAVKNYLRVPAASQNSSLFDLRAAKSINVNIYPWMLRFSALRTKNQRIYITTGIGLQLYNFRYDMPLTYTKNPSGVVLNNSSFKKDKLGVDYLNVPLMLTFKTRLHKDNWLVYGVGITEGVRIDSWNKQVSDGNHKVKVHDAFGIADFNTCVTGEIGMDALLRFYVSYQVTSLYENGLSQHPISFGIRFLGI